MMKMLGAGAFPVAILLIGAVIMDLAVAERPSVRVTLGGSVVRLLLVPAVFLTAAKMLPLIDEMRRVLVVQAAMPAAMTPILLAKLYGGRPAIAVQIVVVTTALTLLTLPLIIAFGVRWIGL
jgi:predicted permease